MVPGIEARFDLSLRSLSTFYMGNSASLHDSDIISNPFPLTAFETPSATPARRTIPIRVSSNDLSSHMIVP